MFAITNHCNRTCSINVKRKQIYLVLLYFNFLNFICCDSTSFLISRVYCYIFHLKWQIGLCWMLCIAVCICLCAFVCRKLSQNDSDTYECIFFKYRFRTLRKILTWIHFLWKRYILHWRYTNFHTVCPRCSQKAWKMPL